MTVVTFSTRFPAAWKEPIRALIQLYASQFGFDLWEFYVRLGASTSNMAEIHAEHSAHAAKILLCKSRLQYELLELDLAHEILHLVSWPLLTEVVNLPKKHFKDCKEAYEEAHDWTSRVLLRLLQPQLSGLRSGLGIATDAPTSESKPLSNGLPSHNFVPTPQPPLPRSLDDSLPG